VINLSPAVSEELSIHGVSEGVVISEIKEGSQAALVNFQIGDVIVAIDDEPIKTTRGLEQAASQYHNYWKLTIRRGGELITTVISG
jgi:S1-C subfamily serine protease